MKILKGDGVGIIPTDTIYGIVGSALSKKAVMRICRLRHRNLKKPMVILIGELEDLEIFKARFDRRIKKRIQKLWPGKVSTVLSCPAKTLEGSVARLSSDFSFRQNRVVILDPDLFKGKEVLVAVGG